jgi:transcription elongation GreA/GreB family factor
MTIKEELYQLCVTHVNERLQTIEHTIQSHQKALTSETKSSAGDKHETGRAMLQLEMEKAGQQLQSIQLMKETLSRIDPTKASEVIRLGSLVETNLASYFLSISAGQLTVKNKVYFAISTSSPIGKLLLGKTVGEQILWNGRGIIIKKHS